MNKKSLKSLAIHREKLVSQAAAERSALIKHFEPLRTPLMLVDKGLTAVHYVKQHPSLMLGSAVLISLLRPIRFIKWLRGGWVVFQLVRDVRSWKKTEDKSYSK